MPAGCLVVLGQNSVFLSETSDAVVGFTHSSDLAADGISLDGVQHTAGGLIDINEVDLDRGVVLGVDDSVAGRAGSFRRNLLEKYFEVRKFAIVENFNLTFDSCRLID